MVDYRVRDQLSPSPVDHEGITVGFNEWIRFAKNNIENIYICLHTILSHVLPDPFIKSNGNSFVVHR